jgi:hypothetical protein
MTHSAKASLRHFKNVRHALEKQAEAASAMLTAQNRLLDAVQFHWDEACTPPERLRPTGS